MAEIVVTAGLLEAEASTVAEGHAGEHAVESVVVAFARCLTHDPRLLQ